MSSVHVWPEEEFLEERDDQPDPAPADTAGDEAEDEPFDDEDWDLPERYTTLLGVSCDAEAPEQPDSECQAFHEGDFVVSRDDTRATRLGYVITHAVTHGWTVIGADNPESALTYCPEHKQAGLAFAAQIDAIKTSRTD